MLAVDLHSEGLYVDWVFGDWIAEMAFLGACFFAYVRSTSYGVFLRNGGRIVVFLPVPVIRLP